MAAGDAGGGLTVAALRRAATARPVELVTATDGNHGRAVAWMGRLLGLKARVFVPRVVPAEASAAIAGEGATVTVVDGPYDRAVELAAAYAAAGQGRALAQDTAWPGYERVPGWIVEGHGTLLREVDAQLAERGVPGPGLGKENDRRGLTGRIRSACARQTSRILTDIVQRTVSLVSDICCGSPRRAEPLAI
ncbi:MAG TPA: pyridoxal-phosphate dependent enzyme, partial [Streptosporangiaceae bacterium]|nr:pyridoxal-phosphate dependent enzyme [Streptosporangiaceae bacterium]